MTKSLQWPSPRFGACGMVVFEWERGGAVSLLLSCAREMCDELRSRTKNTHEQHKAHADQRPSNPPRFRLHEARKQFCLTQNRTFTCNTEHGNLHQREYLSAASSARTPNLKLHQVRVQKRHTQMRWSCLSRTHTATLARAPQFNDAHRDYLSGVGGPPRYWSQMNPYLCPGKWEGGKYKINVQL